MNAVASLKQVERVAAGVSAELRALPVLRDGIAVADGSAGADAENGRLVLQPGTWLLAFATTVIVPHDDTLELRIVIANDPRFVGPTATVEGEIGVAELRDALVNAGVLRRKQAELSGGALRTATSWGFVCVPDDAAGTPCELWARSPGARGDVAFQFSKAELFAVRVGGAK